MRRRWHWLMLVAFVLLIGSGMQGQQGPNHSDVAPQVLADLCIDPQAIDVSSEPALVTVSIELTPDVVEIKNVSVVFELPCFDCSTRCGLVRQEGASQDITWEGTYEFSDSLQCGILDAAVSIELEYEDGRITIVDASQLGDLGLPSFVHVISRVDTTPPEVVCPVDVQVDNDLGLFTAVVDPGMATATDACSVIVTGERGDCLPLDDPYPIGTTPILWIAIDPSGNVSACMQLVDVNDAEGILKTDQEPPTIDCPPDIVTDNDPGVCGAVIDPERATATDDCWTSLCGGRSDGKPFISLYPIGVTTISWTARDVVGNTTTCEQQITVRDSEAPVITSCPPSPAPITTTPGQCFADTTRVTLGRPDATDNCGVASITNDAPVAYPVGNTTVTWTVTDAAGNEATCTQTVTVRDVEGPVITCPGDPSEVNTDAKECYASATRVTLGVPTATDNCAGVSLTNDAPARYPVGNITVTWTATDAAGNEATCTQMVVVEDNEKPSFSVDGRLVIPPVIPPVQVQPEFGRTDAVANLGGRVKPKDNCSVASSYYLTESVPGNKNFTRLVLLSHRFPAGSTNVKAIAIDASGNKATLVFQVRVHDTIPPVISYCGRADLLLLEYSFFMPRRGNVTLSTAPSEPNRSVAFGVIATDNCIPADELTVTYMITKGPCIWGVINSPHLFPIGEHEVTATVSDGNESSNCTFTVIINDNERPVIDAVLDNKVEVNTAKGLATAPVILPGATDNSNAVDVTYAGNRGGIAGSPHAFAIGTTQVTVTAKDKSGNESTYTFDVVVTDNENPVLILNGQAQMDVEAGDVYLEPGARVTDNCCAGGVQIGGDRVDTSQPGTYIITYDSTDCHGNAALQLTRTVRVMGPAPEPEDGLPGGQDLPGLLEGPDLPEDDQVDEQSDSAPSTESPGELCELYHELWEEHMQINPLITQAANRGNDLWNNDAFAEAVQAWENELSCVQDVLEVSERIRDRFESVSEGVSNLLDGVVWYFSLMANDVLPRFLDRARAAADLYRSASTEAQFENADRVWHQAQAVRDEQREAEGSWVGQLEAVAGCLCTTCWTFMDLVDQSWVLMDRFNEANERANDYLSDWECDQAIDQFEEALEWLRQREGLLTEIDDQYRLSPDLVELWDLVVFYSTESVSSYSQFVDVIPIACDVFSEGKHDEATQMVMQAHADNAAVWDSPCSELFEQIRILLCGW